MEDSEARQIIRSRAIEIGPDDHRSPVEIAEQILATGSPAVNSLVDVISVPLPKETPAVQLPKLERGRSYFAG
jgi:hypothetical protein